MTKKYPRNPETICHIKSRKEGVGTITKITRLKVFGGWHITDCELMVIDSKLEGFTKVSSFIPDPDHEWELEKSNTLPEKDPIEPM